MTVTSFPIATFPGILDELNSLAFAYRWSIRAIMLDKTDATKLSKIRRQWFAKRKSIAAIVKEVMTNKRRCWSTAMPRISTCLAIAPTMIWQERRQDDPAHRWLCEQVVAATAHLIG